MVAYLDMSRTCIFVLAKFIYPDHLAIRDARDAAIFGWDRSLGALSNLIVDVRKVSNTGRALRLMTNGWRRPSDERNLLFAWDFRK
jgi:hypothetical protein